jgi:hypothetical protein
MADYGSEDGAANNGFGRRSLHQWEGRLLYMAGYPVLPDFRAPEGWRLSAGGVPIPPPPMGTALDAAIDEVLEGMSDEQRAKPRFYPDNYPAWNAFFRRRYERELASYDGPPPPPARNNAAGRRHWWSAPGRTLEAVLTHTEHGNSPVLGMPPPRELVDATTDGILILGVGVVRVGVKVGITIVGIDAEDCEAGATVRATEAQQRRPRHPRGGAHLVAAAQPQAEAEEGRHQGRVRPRQRGGRACRGSGDARWRIDYTPLGTPRGRYDEHSSKSSLSSETKVYRTSRRKPNFRR